MISLTISIIEQTLAVIDDNQVIDIFPISTAKKGVGEQQGSQQTPRGLHQIVEKIGAGQPVGAVFVGRKPTGEIYTPELAKKFSERDWILTRILWLGGLEYGKNAGGNVDSQARFIYIHGAPDAKPMGIPSSKGCINLHHTDLLHLFDFVEVGTKVDII